MRYQVGSRVKLRVDKVYGDGVRIPAGTRGTVERVYPLSESYLVRFDGYALARRVPDSDLE